MSWQEDLYIIRDFAARTGDEKVAAAVGRLSALLVHLDDQINRAKEALTNGLHR